MTDPYTCEWCGETYVVPSLARQCERTCVARPQEQIR